MPELRELMHQVVDAGARNWQIQLTVAMGNAADNPELLLQPYQVLELMPLLAELHEEAMELGVVLQPANSIGYFGPYEHRWRVVDEALGHWQGCAAGQTSIGIEADGTIKGCPSLPTTAYSGGNVRQMTIEQMWELSDSLRFARDRTVDDLWGFCRTCYYADVCRAGCTWTTHVLFGRAGNNPYCHYRALEPRQGRIAGARGKGRGCVGAAIRLRSVQSHRGTAQWGRWAANHRRSAAGCDRPEPATKAGIHADCPCALPWM